MCDPTPAAPGRPGESAQPARSRAQRFEPGRKSAEREVDAVLKEIHDDHAALRRYLVDDGFMTREAGVYWRSGGTVEF